ncbi:MAG TPA: SRPBCC domain-containing protein [Kofleriaceae bacterium]|nr:SRPBCC domain-containing protein [Kofleriaceae bacterium]
MKVSRVIAAPRSRVFAAWMSKDAVAEWLPPAGMSARIDHFDARIGGGYRMTLTYDGSGHGKTTTDTDVVNVTFDEIVLDERIVQATTFDTKDAAFAGTMTLTWTFADAEPGGGTRVTVEVANAPRGITDADHEKGISSTLDNLATYVTR